MPRDPGLGLLGHAFRLRLTGDAASEEQHEMRELVGRVAELRRE